MYKKKIKKKKTALAEYEVRKEIAGKKGDKNKYPYRPARGKETSLTGTKRRKKVIPFDLIFSHKERWMFPVNGDWSTIDTTLRRRSV